MHIASLQLEHWPLARLLPYANNPRVNDHAVDKMAAAIVEFGFRIPILARSSGEVVDGHMRTKAARKLGLDTVPVLLADDLSEAQIRAFRISVNKSAEWADWDEDLLRAELDALREADFDLSLTGFAADELDALFAGEEPEHAGNTDDDATPEAAQAVVSRPGDVWCLGPHRVLCGDATDPASYDRLLGTDRVAMAWSDLPYNVNYRGGAYTKDKHRPIDNDALGADFGAFLQRALTPLLARCDGAVYIAMSSSELDTLQAAFRAAGGHWSTFLIWAKNHFTLGRSDYQRQYEPILYGWRQGSKRHWCGDRNRGDVLHIDRPARSDSHPTTKPVALVETCIRNSSKVGDAVLDPFGGSGTTLIAAHKSGRVAYLMELDPRYVDVIVRRIQEFTGETATRLADGVAFDEAAGALVPA